MILNIINIVSIIFIPIVVVFIGQFLQDRREKRKDKMKVFTHLMSYRSFGYIDQSSVNILNSVPIVFAKNKRVIQTYNAFMDSLNINPEEAMLKSKEIENNKTRMLEAMAKSLNYKNINWEIIQNPYIPEGLLKQIEQIKDFQQGQINITKFFEKITNPESTNETVSQLGENLQRTFGTKKTIKKDKQ